MGYEGVLVYTGYTYRSIAATKENNERTEIRFVDASDVVYLGMAA